MTRRNLLGVLSAIGLAPKIAPAQTQPPSQPGAPRIEPLNLPDAEWKKRLTPAQYQVLRKEGTEPAGSSPLNNEKRKGRYHCAGCDLPLFASEMKYESGTGWPSFLRPCPACSARKPTTSCCTRAPNTTARAAAVTTATCSTTARSRAASAIATTAWRLMFVPVSA